MTSGSHLAGGAILVAALVLGCTSPAKDPPRNRDTPLVLDCGGTAREETSPSDCAYLLNGRCFTSSEVACACAGCVDECITADSVPVQVSCPTDAGATPPISNGPDEGPNQ